MRKMHIINEENEQNEQNEQMTAGDKKQPGKSARVVYKACGVYCAFCPMSAAA